MQTLLDYLSFNRLISPHVLILLYYVGVIGAPVLAWLLLRRRWRAKWWAQPAWEAGKASLWQLTRPLDRLVFLALFLALEVVWRMMFELGIAYFQMHEWLSQLARQ